MKVTYICKCCYRRFVVTPMPRLTAEDRLRKMMEAARSNGQGPFCDKCLKRFHVQAVRLIRRWNKVAKR